MVGAPFLTASAALRVGAGLVTIASSAEVIDKLEKRVLEIMTLALPSDRLKVMKKFIKERKVSVLVIGPGFGSGQADLIREIIQKVKLPMVIDGGGLAALQDNLGLLSSSEDLILTPHLGEFQKFFDVKLPKNRDRLKAAAAKFASDNGVTLVLKGQPTYVAHRDGKVYINTTGGPALATAGSGDVLSGIIAGLVAQRIEQGEAAEAGVYLHGLAGDIAAKEKTEAGVIASDVIEALPGALKKTGQ